MSKKLTTEEFIRRAKEIHGEKYDYSQVEYINSEHKVKIICSEHGVFEQYPLNHLKGFGCRECGYVVRNEKQSYTLKDFKTKAKEIHGDKYDYSKAKYTNSQTKTCIICPEHGEFWQTPAKHLSGQGCKLCTEGGKYTTEEFINKAKQLHGEKFDYSCTVYKDSRLPVDIRCMIHGVFKISPHAHLQGRGCVECGNERRRNSRRFKKEEFVKRAKEKYGDKYDYSEVVYINSCTNINII